MTSRFFDIQLNLGSGDRSSGSRFFLILIAALSVFLIFLI